MNWTSAQHYCGSGNRYLEAKNAYFDEHDRLIAEMKALREKKKNDPDR
jgi:hypothetical protein